MSDDQFYSFKSFYKIYAIGSPKTKQKPVKESVMIEERIVVFKAKSFDEEFKKERKRRINMSMNG